MQWRARAPGKLVVFGEYAVLDGAEALVLAVDRHCHARIDTDPDVGAGSGTAPHARHGRVTTFVPGPLEHPVVAGVACGVAIVDLAIERWGELDGVPGWAGQLDSREFFSGQAKLGLGSSAAALCAWSGAYAAAARATGATAAARPVADAGTLIGLHRRLQGGSGSGLDVATSLSGGAVRFRLAPGAVPQIGSVRLPNSVGFAGVFTGSSASTPDFIARYRAWQSEQPKDAGEWLARARSISEAGCVSAREGDAPGFLACVAEYGRELDNLGTRLMCEVVTDAHREIGRLAARYGIVYKVSGAGGGDLGIAMSSDREALREFRAAAGSRGFEWLELNVDEQGLIVEELSP